jgi:hypothetical protein
VPADPKAFCSASLPRCGCCGCAGEASAEDSAEEEDWLSDAYGDGDGEDVIEAAAAVTEAEAVGTAAVSEGEGEGFVLIAGGG